jgi:hypothetical protein
VAGRSCSNTGLADTARLRAQRPGRGKARVCSRTAWSRARSGGLSLDDAGLRAVVAPALAVAPRAAAWSSRLRTHCLIPGRRDPRFRGIAGGARIRWPRAGGEPDWSRRRSDARFQDVGGGPEGAVVRDDCRPDDSGPGSLRRPSSLGFGHALVHLGSAPIPRGSRFAFDLSAPKRSRPSEVGAAATAWVLATRRQRVIDPLAKGPRAIASPHAARGLTRAGVSEIGRPYAANGG